MCRLLSERATRLESPVLVKVNYRDWAMARRLIVVSHPIEESFRASLFVRERSSPLVMGLPKETLEAIDSVEVLVSEWA